MAAPKLNSLKSSLSTLPHRLSAAQPIEANRVRGGAGVKRRSGFLANRPLCAECDKEGNTRIATIADHKTPLWAGGAYLADMLARAKRDAGLIALPVRTQPAEPRKAKPQPKRTR